MLDKRKTGAMHGIAILMMIYHHLFMTGNFWSPDNNVSLLSVFDKLDFTGSGSAQLGFAWFCKICVAIFAFTSGYAMYIQLDKKNGFLDRVKYIPKRIWSFYKKYVLAFIYFVSLTYLMMRETFKFNIGNIVLSFLGLKAGFNDTWWYVPVYYLMVVLSPFVYEILKRVNLKGYLLVGGIFGLSLIIAFVTGNGVVYLKAISRFVQNNTTIYVLIFVEGMFIARYGLLDKIGSRLNLLSSIVLLIAVFVCRSILIRDPGDPLFDLIFITPFVISVTRILSYSNCLTGFFGYFGKYSTYMWYSHAYFYAYMFYWIIIPSDLSFVVYLQVVGYSLAYSIGFSAVEDKLFNRKRSEKLA